MQNHNSIGAKRDAKVYKNRFVLYISRGIYKIFDFFKKKYTTSLLINKNGLCWACGTSKTTIKSMNITSNTNCPGNGTRKLVEEVVPPQSVVAGEGSSSAWVG